MKGVKAHIQVPEGTILKYLKILAYILQELVVKEIERLQAAGSIVSATYSE